MGFGPQSIGKRLIFIGLAFVLVGGREERNSLYFKNTRFSKASSTTGPDLAGGVRNTHPTASRVALSSLPALFLPNAKDKT